MEPDEKQTTLYEYLLERTANGKTYFKAKFMANDLPLSTKEIGSNLLVLAERDNALSITKHAESRSTTWKVTQQVDADATAPATVHAAD